MTTHSTPILSWTLEFEWSNVFIYTKCWLLLFDEKKMNLTGHCVEFGKISDFPHGSSSIYLFPKQSKWQITSHLNNLTEFLDDLEKQFFDNSEKESFYHNKVFSSRFLSDSLE